MATFYEDTMQRRRMLPQTLGMASPDGVLTQNVQPGSALPMTAQRYREMALKYGQEAADAEAAEPDLTAAQDYLRKRGEGGSMATLLALAAQAAGEDFAPIQAHYLKRAAAASDPLKIGTGMLTPDGQYVRDTVADAQRKAAAKARQAQAYEQMATGLETAEQRRLDALERARQADEFKRMGMDLQQQLLQFRRDMAANRQQGDSQVGSFTPAGFTPQGQQVVTNTKSGVSYLLNILPDGTPNYTPYQGAMIPKATFEKNTEAARQFSAKVDSADALIRQIDSNPNAFSMTAAAVSKLPSAVQGRVGAFVLDKDTLKLRADVLRQAAMEISDIYGAAQSIGEAARAATFIPNPEDPPEVVIGKLRAARDYARSNASALGSAVNRAATQRSGNPAEASQEKPKKRIRYDAQGNEIP